MFLTKMVLPDDKLTKWIKAYWFLKGNGNGIDRVSKRILPDGCATILFVLNGEMKFEIFNNEILTRGAYVVPPVLSSYHGLISDDFFSIDIQLNPSIFFKLYNLPVEKLQKTIYTFEDLSLKFDKTIIEKLLLLQNNNMFLFETLNGFLINLFHQNDFYSDDIVLNVRELYKTGNLDKFFKNQNLSIRQIERKVKSFTGLTPKNISRMGRFYSVLEQMKYSSVNLNLTDLAYNNQFSDQSHFIREFKSFSEISPGQFLKNINTYPQYRGLSSFK